MGSPGHMSVFFGEIPAADQVAFAAECGVGAEVLQAAAREFATLSGEDYPLARLDGEPGGALASPAKRTARLSE